jgi:hypothetical protein
MGSFLDGVRQTVDNHAQEGRFKESADKWRAQHMLAKWIWGEGDPGAFDAVVRATRANLVRGDPENARRFALKSGVTAHGTAGRASVEARFADETIARALASAPTAQDDETGAIYVRLHKLARKHGANSPQGASVNYALGICHLIDFREDDAVGRFRNALSVFAASCGTESPEAGHAREELAVVLGFTGRHAEAAEVRREILASAEAISGPGSREAVDARKRVALELDADFLRHARLARRFPGFSADPLTVTPENSGNPVVPVRVLRRLDPLGSGVASDSRRDGDAETLEQRIAPGELAKAVFHPVAPLAQGRIAFPDGEA